MMSDDCTRVRPNPLPYQTRPEKIHSRHRERLAIVYIRNPRPSRWSAIRNRRGCSMRWLNRHASSAGIAMQSWSSTMTSDTPGPPSKVGWVSSGLWLRSASVAWAWFWASKCPALRVLVWIGINCWRSARCSTRSSLIPKACMIPEVATMTGFFWG